MKKHPKVKVKCAFCGKIFKIHFYRLKNSKKVYCNRECQHQGLIKRKPKTFICSTCGKFFVTIRHKVTKSRKHFCSHKCQVEYFKKKWNKAGRDAVKSKPKSLVTKTCLNCHKKFIVYKSQVKERKYCSNKCKYEHLKKIGHYHRLSEIHKKHPPKGKKNGMFGKPCPNKHLISKSGHYKGIWMRSTWEIKYAKYLDKLGVKWQYESKRFNLGNLTYLPDFYLPEKNLYVEIKGYMSPGAYKRIKKFIKQFPEEKLIILKEKELKKLKIIK